MHYDAVWCLMIIYAHTTQHYHLLIASLSHLIGQQEAMLASDWMSNSEALHSINMTTGMGLLAVGDGNE